jgi:hypothetical protein
MWNTPLFDIGSNHASSKPLSSRIGVIVSINKDESCGERFDRSARDEGVWNHPDYGPAFHRDLYLSSNFHENLDSRSRLGNSYGSVGVDEAAFFRQVMFRVLDYEVFKIVDLVEADADGVLDG